MLAHWLLVYALQINILSSVLVLVVFSSVCCFVVVLCVFFIVASYVRFFFLFRSSLHYLDVSSSLLFLFIHFVFLIFASESQLFIVHIACTTA